MTTHYRIADPTEETACCGCGTPLMMGDYAVMSDDERHVGCCTPCVKGAERAAELLTNPEV